MKITSEKIVMLICWMTSGFIFGYNCKSSKVVEVEKVVESKHKKEDYYDLLRGVSPSIFVAGYSAGHNATKKLLETGTYSYDNVISKMKVDSIEFMSTMNRIYATDSIK